jgi:hypothetical protein
MISRILLLLGLLWTAPAAWAQRPFVDDFTLSGDTYLTEDFCFRLTEARDYRSGSIWYKYPADLTQPFSIELSIMAGCKDVSGADGMVFVFAPQANRLGYVGEGIGFAGLVPSVGIEIDTWRNEHLNDPAEDHLAMMVNGRVGHFSKLAQPQVIANIEDCTRHRFVVRWKPELQKLWVEIDGREVAALNADLVNQVFEGNGKVYWGVTAATGRYNNIHEVCFDRMTQGPPAFRVPYRWRAE